MTINRTIDYQLPLPPALAAFHQVPHLADYFGLWSIHEPIFRAAVERVGGIDLSAHVRSQAAQEAVQRQADDEYETTPDGIALFQIQGPMMKSASSLSGGTSTIRLRQQIRAARKNTNVVAALMVMDTPGGTVKGNRDLADEVAAFAATKPIFAYIDDLTASAGVSVASQASKRFANNSTALYGAMGTYSVLIDAKRAADNAGFTVHVIKAGEFKGMGELGTAISDEQLAEAQRIVNALNDQYIELIARGLNVPVAQVKPVADGRIHPAADAVGMGLIDGIQSYETTYRQLVAAAQAKGPKSKGPKSTTGVSKMDPATLAQLKEKFPKSSAEWRETQIEASATIETAAVNYANFLEERGANLQQQLDAANKANKQPKPGKGTGDSLGHKPLAERRLAKKTDADDDEDENDDTSSSGYCTGDAIADFNASVRRIAGRNPSLAQRQSAIRLAIKRDPDLYRQYLLANNPNKRQARLIDEKLESAS